MESSNIYTDSVERFMFEYDARRRRRNDARRSRYRRFLSLMLTLHRGHVNRRNRMLRIMASEITIKKWSLERSPVYFEEIVPKMNDDEFKDIFKMTPASFNKLVEEVSPYIKITDTIMRKCIPLRERVGITLLRLGSDMAYSNISELVGRGKSSCLHCTHSVTEVITTHLLNKYICPPEDDELVRSIANFEEKTGLPQVASCIFQLNVQLLRPQDYINGHTPSIMPQSLLIQMLVDDKDCFTDIDTDWYVYESKDKSFQNSKLLKLGEAGKLFPGNRRLINSVEVPPLILGEPSYPLLPCLMKPYEGNELSSQQKSFNEKFQKARYPVKSAIHKLKSRWRCLLSKIDCSTYRAKTFVLTCCILHNFCEKNNDFFLNSEVETKTSSYDNGSVNNSRTKEAVDIRDALSNYVCNNHN